MKKFFVIFAALIFIVSCGDDVIKVSKGDPGESQTDEDTADTSADTVDTSDTTPDESDSEDSQPDQDTGTADPDDDPAVPQPDEDTGTADPDDDTTVPQSDEDTGTADPDDDDPADSQSDEDTGTADPDDNDPADSQSDEDADSYEKEEYEKTIPVPENQNNELNASCDFETFVEFCDESTNTAVYCYENKVQFAECGGGGKTCMTTIGLFGGNWKNKNYAACYNSCETLKQDTQCIDSEPSKDYRAGGLLEKFLCLKTSKGNLDFFVSEQCDTPCNADRTACIEPYKAPEGQNNENDAPCDPETFVEFCDGNSVVSCIEGTVFRAGCSQSCLTTIGLYGEGVGKNTANCYFPCEEPGPINTSPAICKDKTYYYGDGSFKLGSLRQDYCLATSQGRSYFSGIITKECNTACNSNGTECIGLKNPGTQNNEEGAACDVSTFIETCDLNTSVYCANGNVRRWDCTGSGLVCTATKGIFDPTDKNYTFCYKTCSESLQRCDSEDVGERIIGFITYNVCTKTSSGWVDFEFPRVQTCFEGCASDDKHCAE